jgi:pimeloyl-ACP methyl ester carboxylesterase
VGTDFYQTLLSEGWTIASTGFQSNDWVVAEGGMDILALQKYIETKIHPIKRSFIYGETMGGGVAVWLAENEPERFNGVLCLGAHLFPEPEPDTTTRDVIAEIFRAEPKLPIIFLANGKEMLSSRAYTEQVADSDYTPITWFIDRSGHVNVNSAERLAAMRALLDWSEGQPIESVEDGTLVMSPSSVAAIGDQIAAANIRLLRPLYGNIYTNFVMGDLEQLGIKIGDKFTIAHGTQTHPITFAKAYSDVPYGEWVAFMDSEGYVQVSRNYANAAETLGAEVGNPLMLIKAR